MYVKRSVAVTLAIALLCSFAVAATANNWIAVNSSSNQKADVRLLSQSKGGLTIAASLSGLEKELLSAEMTGSKGEAFAELTIPGFAYTNDMGKPKLPIITAVLDAPIGAEVSVSIIDGNYREYQLSALGIDARIVPALPSVPKMEGAKPRFVYDAATYGANAMYPGTLAAAEDQSKAGGLARGHRLVTIQLYPVQYNPATGMVRIYSDLKADVRFVGGDYAKSARLVRQDYSRDWESFIQRMVLNYDGAQYASKDSLINLPIYYDIFYGPSFSAAAQRLATWKTQKGYRVRINNAGGWTAAQINDSIRLRSPKATYVAVIGDPNATGTDALPPSGTGAEISDQTDLYYAETNESGYLPDLFNARLSVKTAADADVVVNKLINYEKANFGAAGTAWLKKATLIAGYDGSWQTRVGIKTSEYCRAILAREGYTTIDTFVYGSGEQEGRVVNAINAGRAWTVYTAHGGQDNWCVGYSGTFTVDELNSELTNTDMYTMPVGHCCLTNDYQYSTDCFGESWPKAPGKGGVSYFGSVPSTYWWEDDWLQRRYFDAIYDSIPNVPNTHINEVGRFTQYGLYWIENNVPTGSGSDSTTTALKQYYFEAYHVMNDPSMDFWTDVPHTLAVTHAPGVAPFQGNFAVNVKEGATNIQNALVCCWVKNEAGVQYSGYTDASGNITLPVQPTTPGDTMLVTVTKHNFAPYEGQALVIVPATVTIAPDSVVVNTPTPVTVTVAEPGTGTPVPNIAVTISGYGVDPALADTTDGTGVAHFNVNAPYGENLRVTGREVGETYDMFTDTLRVVGAANLSSAGVTVAVPDVGLNGVVTPDYEAQFTGTASPDGFDLLVTGCGLSASGNTAGGSLVVNGTPTALGTVTAAIAKSGYNIYTTTFPCRTVYGTLAGQVTEQGAGTPVSGVKLDGWISGADTTLTPALFHVTTNGTGNYTVPDSLVVGRYDLYASKFGYIDVMETPMVVYGPNTHDFTIQAAPSGAVSGTVTESGTGLALYGTVKVYRTDDNSLYATVYTDTLAGGSYSVPGLPYFNYNFVVTSYHHKKITRAVTVSGPTRTEDFVMTPTSGDILVINDHDAKAGEASKVVGYAKSGAPIVVRGSGEAVKAGESAAQMANLLGELGYSVTSETSGATNAATWSGYDVVVWSCGRDQSPLSVAGYRTNLIAYVNGGGKLLLEGGEIAYDWDTEDAAFSSGVMHANDWDTDNAGALTLQQAGHPLATTPNALPASLAVAYGSDYGDQDASKPTNNGQVVYGTTSYPADGGIIAYDNDGDPTNGQIVYYLFNMTVLADSATRGQLLENTMEYLLRPSAGPTATLSGVAHLSGQSDHSGIVVTATLGGTTYSDTTDAAGSYSMPVYDGTYLVTGAKAGYVDTASSRLVTVAGSGSAALVLYPVVVAYENDFEGNNGGLTGTGCWEYGVPTSGPGSSHSGTKLWATTLAGNYPNSSNSTLTLPVLNSLAAGMTLEFWHWHSFEGTTTLYDGGNVKVSTDGGSTWGVVTPAGGYTGTAYASTPGVGGQQIFGGSSGGWLKKTFSLAPYAGQNTLVRLHFGSDGSQTYAGWYVDDIMIYGIDYTGVAANPATPSGLPREYLLGAAYPNPGHGAMTICYQLPKSDRVELALYNVAGQLVRTLASGERNAGYHSVRWDGRDANGKQVSSGIYLYRLSTPSYAKTGKLSMVR